MKINLTLFCSDLFFCFAYFHTQLRGIQQSFAYNDVLYYSHFSRPKTLASSPRPAPVESKLWSRRVLEIATTKSRPHKIGPQNRDFKTETSKKFKTSKSKSSWKSTAQPCREILELGCMMFFD